jgi:hypothetical protein
MKRFASLAAIFALALSAGVACGGPAVTAAQSPTLSGCPILPVDNIWNTPVDTLPVDTNSAAYIANIDADATTLHPDFGSLQYGYFGIPYNTVTQGYPKASVTFDYDDESDAGPYPIPTNPNIEGGGDKHILVVEQGICKLYETWDSRSNGDGTWSAGSGALFDLRSNALRPPGYTSADAAGLPILPGLARYEEVDAGAINHALRFTTYCTADRYVWPARHKAVPSYCPGAGLPGLPPPIGQRFRLRAGFDVSRFGAQTQVILKALKKYGMIVADNGSSWYISGTPDPGWDDDQLVGDLRQIHGTDFEAVDVSSLMVDPNSGQVALDRKEVVPRAAYEGQHVRRRRRGHEPERPAAARIDAGERADHDAGQRAAGRG